MSNSLSDPLCHWVSRVPVPGSNLHSIWPRSEQMAFADPTSYTKGQINRAGDDVRSGNPSEKSLALINSWRASHAYILNTYQAVLRRRTRKTQIIVAQRLKRLNTIIHKLSRQNRMELARMDDIAGCRLIFPSFSSLVAFRQDFHRARFDHKRKNEPDKYNYIGRPKPDGYRGIHDVYEYSVSSDKGRGYNGLLMELQYRTKYQHAWATSVEIIGMITENQPKFAAGDERHKEFFRLASEIIARVYEKQNSCYPNVGAAELVRRFRELDDEIHVLATLKNLNRVNRHLDAKKNFILSFGTTGRLDLFGYVKGADALKKYFALERAGTGADIVLVRGDTGRDIKTAYKNYFSDPEDFIKYIERGCSALAGRTPRRKIARRK